MPWTKAARIQYQRSGLRYTSDLTDAEWVLIARKMPPRRRLGRPREIDLREIVQAIFYILSSGLPMASLAERVPAILDGAGLFLRLARYGQMAGDRRSLGSEGAPETRTKAPTDSSRHRQSDRIDDGGRRATRIRRRQAPPWAQAPYRYRHQRSLVGSVCSSRQHSGCSWRGAPVGGLARPLPKA
jgi:hypothetical protein